MKQITRREALTLICKKKLSSLDHDRRASLILNWWGIDEEDGEFSELTTELQHEILDNEDPPDDVSQRKYDQLILIALEAEFIGVTNTFIEEMLCYLEVGDYQVTGNPEKMETCPCCGYRTLDSRGDYDICGLCNWEDNGVQNDAQYSGPNHMTLGEAKIIFNRNKENLPLGKWAKD